MNSRQQALVRLATFVGIGLVLVLFFAGSIFKTINAGELGIIYRPFGGGLDKEQIFPQGLHVIAPWNKLIVYNVREQIQEENLNVISSDGLNIQIDVSCRFKPMPNKIGHLHDEIGEGYQQIIVKDLIRTTVRKVVGRFTPEELYSSKRDQVESEIVEVLESYLVEKHVTLQSAFVRSIKLPKQIEDAIQDKLSQEQESLKYEFKIDRERKEKERKMIEAQGIKEFQRIVSEGISDKLLKWKGIEATQDLAKSTNSKVVIIGGGKDGLPIILGGDK